MGLNGFDLSNHFLVSEHSQVRQLVPSEMVEIGRICPRSDYVLLVPITPRVQHLNPILSFGQSQVEEMRRAKAEPNALYEKDQQTLPILWLL